VGLREPTHPDACRGQRRQAFQPQRGCIIQPRAARHELPWEQEPKTSSTLKGLNGRVVAAGASDATPLGLGIILADDPG